MSNYLLKLLKNDPQKLINNISNINQNELYTRYFLNNTILHLAAIHYPLFIDAVFDLLHIVPEMNYNMLYNHRNFFGYTWLHILCQYNMKYYNYLQDFIQVDLINMKDIVGNTCLHIISRFNPEYLEAFLKNPHINDNLLFSKDILGNTFLHTLNYYNPEHYNKIERLFNNNIIDIKNIFGNECYNYFQEY